MGGGLGAMPLGNKMKKLFYIFLLISLSIVSCNEEPIIVPIPTVLRITSPVNNSLAKELSSVFIKIETNLNISGNKIELFGFYYDLSSDTSKIAEFEQPPYEKSLYLEQICIETDTLTLFAKATFNSNEVVTSNSVKIVISKIMPPDDSLDIYDYEGFDLDSNLVAEGSFSFYLKDNQINGRKNIAVVQPDSAFEYGTGFIDGQKYSSQYGEYHIQMNVCYLLNANGRLFIYLDGIMDGNKFYGGRYLGAFDPLYINIGTFVAVKRE